MVYSTQPRAERAILVGVSPKATRPRGDAGSGRTGDGGPPEGASLQELGQLAQTAGCEVAGHVRQARASIHPATFVSKGKLAELKDAVAAHEANLVVFDAELSPAQMRNLEQSLECKVVDRTELILDIFATRAQTREAQVQVELAQLQYLLPRLTRLWGHLERQEGGIGTRGPGEKQLEVDRRLVRERISMLQRRLEEIEDERRTRTRRRQRMFRAALIGYTNAGKSTLFNAVTRAGVLEEDRLFATLDTTTRRLGYEAGRALLLSDTVGFIRKLPHHLVASFRATLGEVREADLLVHVIDAAHPSMRQQMAAVDEVTEELLEGRATPRLLVLNKADLLTEEQVLGLRAEFPTALLLSARDREQARRLRSAIATAALETAEQPS
jgi:GTPase